MENNKDILGVCIDLCGDLLSLNYENKMVDLETKKKYPVENCCSAEWFV